MNSPPRNPPRFIPTLTEVVDPARLTSIATKSNPDTEAMINMVQRQVRPIFERRLEEEFDRMVRSMVARQWADIGARLQDEMDMFVRQAVTDALNSTDVVKSPK